MCVVCANLFLTQCKEKVTSSLFFCKGKRIGEVCVAGGGGGATPHTFGREGQDGAEKKKHNNRNMAPVGKKEMSPDQQSHFFLLFFT